MKAQTLTGDLIRVRGVISEADQDLLSFKLRDLEPADGTTVDENGEIIFRFPEHPLDVVVDAFTTLERVVVFGEREGGRNLALDIKFGAPPSAEEQKMRRTT
jgi:hypothetical protein